jgi:hypothetical protein
MFKLWMILNFNLHTTFGVAWIGAYRVLGFGDLLEIALINEFINYQVMLMDHTMLGKRSTKSYHARLGSATKPA